MGKIWFRERSREVTVAGMCPNVVKSTSAKLIANEGPQRHFWPSNLVEARDAEPEPKPIFDFWKCGAGAKNFHTHAGSQSQKN